MTSPDAAVPVRRVPLLLLVLSAAAGVMAFAAVAWVFVDLRLEERRETVAQWGSRLESVADARKRSLQAWLAERRADAEVLAWDPDLIGLCTEGACPKGKDPLVLRAHLDNLQMFAGFLGASLFTPSGEPLLTAATGAPPPPSAGVMARRVAREARYLLHDLHGPEPGAWVLGFLAPVFGDADPRARPLSSPVLGVVGLYLDPSATLLPILQAEEAAVPTLEVYLVRRTEGGARAITPVGGRTEESGEPLDVPVERSDAIEIAALEAKETAGTFLDHRGRRVLGAVRWISDAGWGLVTRVDEDVALADWQRGVMLEGGLLLAGLLCLTLGGVAAWRTWAGRRYRLLLEGIRDREERLRALALGTEDVVFVKDTQGRFLLVNPPAAKLLGTSPGEALGRRTSDFLPESLSAVLQQHDGDALASGRPYQGEERIPVLGEERTFLAARVPLRDSHGRVTGVAGVLRDITDRKRIEEANAQRAQTLGSLYRLARSLTLAGSPSEILAAVLEGATAALGADAASVYVAEPSSGDLLLKGETGLGEAHREFRRQLKAGRGPEARAVETGELVVIDGSSSGGPGWEWLAEEGVLSVAAVSLHSEGRGLGAVALYFRRERQFSQEEREGLRILGHMAGAALERARTRQALEAEADSRRRAERRLRRLHESTAGLTGERLFRQVVRALSQELRARWVVIARLDGDDGAVPLAAVENGEPLEMHPYRLEGTPCREVVRKDAVALFPSGLRSSFPDDDFVRRNRVEAYAGAPLRDSHGEVVGILCALHDERLELSEADRDVLDLYARRGGGEVERLQGEQNLAQTRRTLETLIQNLPGAVYRCGGDAGRSVQYISAGCEPVTGYQPTSFTSGSSTLADLIVPEDRARVAREQEAALRSGRAYEIQYRIHDAEGRVRWVYDVGQALPAGDGQSPGLEGVLFDHTETRSLEVQLTHSQRMEALGRLAGGVAHDFNNLLTAIAGYAEVLTMKLPEGERTHHAAAEILRASDRAAALTRQLLAFGRRQVVEPRDVDVNECVRGVARMLERVLGEDVEFGVDLDPEAGTIRSEPAQLEQVVMNLAVNARDAMPRGGTLTLSTRVVRLAASSPGTPGLAAGRYAVLEVSDTGTGMAPEIVEHIFEPFFTTKEEGKGTGLGLATVYGIVRQAGGEVVVESEPGRGSTFRVFWPSAEAGEAEIAEEAPAPAVVGRGRILLVEDDDAVRSMAADYLGSLGYSVVSFPDGAAAIADLGKLGSFDVLVTDVVMPGVGGPQLATRVRRDHPGLPVVFVSGHAGEGTSELAASDRGTLFLPKPFRLAELGRALESVLPSGSGAA